MIPSSFEDVTPAMREQSTRVSRNYQRRNGGKIGETLFHMFDFQKKFHSRDVSCTLSRRFVRLGFCLNCAPLAVHYFAVYSVLGSF